MPKPIDVLCVGLGPIGASVARQLQAHPGLRITGAVDVDPAKVGRDLGLVVGARRRFGVKVEPELAAAQRRRRAAVAVLCTSSSLRGVWPQLRGLAEAGLSVVSTTEELAWPWYSQAPLARRIDALARRCGVAILGTGVNPGFAMDALPIALTAVCARVDAIRVERVQDAAKRRLPFQQKIGAGLTRGEFLRHARELKVRHVGFTESVAMIADAVGLKLDDITDVIKPRLARRPVRSRFLSVPAGRVCGLVQTGQGVRRGRPVVTLHMEAYLGAPESYDAIYVEGEPPLHVKAIGGIHGDVATASMVVNSIPRLIAAAPGLHSMRSLPLPSFFGT